MKSVLAVALGGAVGSALRYLISKFVQVHLGLGFPLGTMLVNVIGAFLIGFSFSFFVERLGIHPIYRLLFITGFLGGFTTFSTFTYESLTLLREGESLKFLIYFLGTNIIGMLAVFIGYKLGEVL
ncbi:fluoride efflux transporter CrcB [Aquifex pyrophilus]